MDRRRWGEAVAMTLRSRILVYLIVLHLVLGVVAVFALLQKPLLLFVIELLFVLSVLVSTRLLRALFVPLDLIQTGAELIEERDFTSKFVAVGQPEMDRLIDVYNRMIDRLREERLAAEEQHQLLGKIVDASPAGIVICDFDGNVEATNPAARRLLGNDRESRLWSELQTIAPGESRLIADFGARRLRASCSAFRDRGFLKSFYLIEEMTDELRISEKAAYEKLIRIMTHEVNNSVGAVRSLLESSLRYASQVGERDRDDFTNALTIASARVDALNRFMSAFADVVRIPPPSPAPAVVADLVLRTAAVMRPELEERKIVLELDVADRRAFDVDANQIEQVLLNILRNAMESIGRDGTLRVTFRDGTLVVADSGPGIQEAIRSELFTPFFTTKRDGRGLGLTIVQEILANHALPFSLANGLRGGAEFRVTFAGG